MGLLSWVMNLGFAASGVVGAMPPNKSPLTVTLATSIAVNQITPVTSANSVELC